MNQQIISSLIFSFILITCLLLWREILLRSLIGAKGLSARNAINQAGIYVSFNWLRWWLRFETKITERSKANRSTPELPSDAPLKIVLEGNYTKNIRNSTTTFFPAQHAWYDPLMVASDLTEVDEG